MPKPKTSASAPGRKSSVQSDLRWRIALHATIAIIFLSGIVSVFRICQIYVDRRLAFPARPPKVVLVNRPAWMSGLSRRRDRQDHPTDRPALVVQPAASGRHGQVPAIQSLDQARKSGPPGLWRISRRYASDRLRISLPRRAGQMGRLLLAGRFPGHQTTRTV